MTKRVIKLKQFGESGWQERIQFPLDKLLAIEGVGQSPALPKSSIQVAFARWQNQHRNGQVRENAFDLEPIPGLLMSVIDVTADDPYHYRFAMKRDRYFRWMESKPLAEFPYSEITLSCSNEYYACKTASEPVGHHISHDLDGFKRSYLRLLLPLTDRSGRVSALACVSRHLDPPAPA